MNTQYLTSKQVKAFNRITITEGLTVKFHEWGGKIFAVEIYSPCYDSVAYAQKPQGGKFVSFHYKKQFPEARVLLNKVCKAIWHRQPYFN